MITLAGGPRVRSALNWNRRAGLYPPQADYPAVSLECLAKRGLDT
jgi:hypothetical protein